MRRPRYGGTHPRSFEQKYKELNPEQYPDAVEKVRARGQTPAGSHRPICVDEILEVLSPQPGEQGLDCTLGWGGHSEELLRRIQPLGLLVATDVDPFELPRTEARLRALGFPANTLSVHRQNFAEVQSLVGLTRRGFDFVLADLGISSMQIDNPERGFTFKATGPLDLRLDPSRGQSAAAYLLAVTAPELELALTEFSDEPQALRISRALCERRGSVRTTTDLVNIVRKAVSKKVPDENDQKKTLQRTFQALRIAVNHELESLDRLLADLPECLAPGGRLAILTFHSGEERRVRAALSSGLQNGFFADVSNEPLRASAQERYDNPRSKSARLHWARAAKKQASHGSTAVVEGR